MKIGIIGAGNIGATAGDVIVTVEGRLENAGQVASVGGTRIDVATVVGAIGARDSVEAVQEAVPLELVEVEEHGPWDMLRLELRSRVPAVRGEEQGRVDDAQVRRAQLRLQDAPAALVLRQGAGPLAREPARALRGGRAAALAARARHEQRTGARVVDAERAAVAARDERAPARLSPEHAPPAPPG